MCGNKNYISGSFTVYLSVWQSCLYVLQDELPSQQFSMWVRPLQAESTEDTLTIYAPNRFVLDWVREKYLNRINELLVEICGVEAPELRFDVGSKPLLNAQAAPVVETQSAPSTQSTAKQPPREQKPVVEPAPKSGYKSNIKENYTFDSFVEGKSNQLAKAAATQVADNPGSAFNPVFIYGGTGLGKTHLLHAVGNGIMANKPDAKDAVRFGADGIIVSNHGGRQLDGVLSSARALPEIADAVKGEIKILVDSGIRTGLDVVRMLALGADCTLLGRAFVYALATAGQAGVENVLDLIEKEMRVAMTLTGAKNIHELNRDALVMA